jgi:hypothetical protein
MNSLKFEKAGSHDERTSHRGLFCTLIGHSQNRIATSLTGMAAKATLDWPDYA